MAWPPPLIARPASTAARTARPRSTPAIERPEPVACPPVERQREGRAVEPLLEPRRDEADDARRPGLARHDHDRRAALLEAERQQRLGLGLGERRDLDLLPRAVQPVEFGGDGARLEVVGAWSGAGRPGPRRRCARPR